MNLSEKEIQELREIFNMIDTTHRGQITKQELFNLMNKLNLKPTEEEQCSMLSNVLDNAFLHPNGQGTQEGKDHFAKSQGTANNRSGPNNVIDFNQFVSIMAKRIHIDYTPEQLRNAFKQFETNDLPAGIISTNVLKQALMTYGSEKLSSEDAEQLIAIVDPESTGEINYLNFVSLLFGNE